jgi:hypothetical protein
LRFACNGANAKKDEHGGCRPEEMKGIVSHELPLGTDGQRLQENVFDVHVSIASKVECVVPFRRTGDAWG